MKKLTIKDYERFISDLSAIISTSPDSPLNWYLQKIEIIVNRDKECRKEFESQVEKKVRQILKRRNK